MKIGRQCTNISLFVLVIAKCKTFVTPLATVTFYFFPGHITIYPAVILLVLNTFWVLMTLPLAFLLLEWSGKSSERLATWTHRSTCPVSLNVESMIGHLGPGLENVWDLTVAFIRMTSVILLTFGTFAISPPSFWLFSFCFLGCSYENVTKIMTIHLFKQINLYLPQHSLHFDSVMNNVIKIYINLNWLTLMYNLDGKY